MVMFLLVNRKLPWGTEEWQTALRLPRILFSRTDSSRGVASRNLLKTHERKFTKGDAHACCRNQFKDKRHSEAQTRLDNACHSRHFCCFRGVNLLKVYSVTTENRRILCLRGSCKRIMKQHFYLLFYFIQFYGLFFVFLKFMTHMQFRKSKKSNTQILWHCVATLSWPAAQTRTTQLQWGFVPRAVCSGAELDPDICGSFLVCGCGRCRWDCCETTSTNHGFCDTYLSLLKREQM